MVTGANHSIPFPVLGHSEMGKSQLHTAYFKNDKNTIFPLIIEQTGRHSVHAQENYATLIMIVSTQLDSLQSL